MPLTCISKKRRSVEKWLSTPFTFRPRTLKFLPSSALKYSHDVSIRIDVSGAGGRCVITSRLSRRVVGSTPDGGVSRGRWRSLRACEWFHLVSFKGDIVQNRYRRSRVRMWAPSCDSRIVTASHQLRRPHFHCRYLASGCRGVVVEIRPRPEFADWIQHGAVFTKSARPRDKLRPRL